MGTKNELKFSLYMLYGNAFVFLVLGATIMLKSEIPVSENSSATVNQMIQHSALFIAGAILLGVGAIIWAITYIKQKLKWSKKYTNY